MDINMDQQLFNVVLGVACALGGWWMKAMWESLKDLQVADKALVEKVSKIEVLVAGEYVKRDDFQEFSKAIFTKLDRIEDKVDSKADK
jgi:hypothetical protein